MSPPPRRWAPAGEARTGWSAPAFRLESPQVWRGGNAPTRRQLLKLLLPCEGEMAYGTTATTCAWPRPPKTPATPFPLLKYFTLPSPCGKRAGKGGGRRAPRPSLLDSPEPTWSLPSPPRYLAPYPPTPPAPAVGLRQVCHHCSSAVLAERCAPSAVLTPAAGAGAAGAGATITGALHVGQLGASQLLSHFRMHLQGRGRWRVRHQSARHRAASRRHPRDETHAARAPLLLCAEGSPAEGSPP